MNDPQVIFDLLYAYSYFVLFPLVVVEGPIATVIAGFLSSTGFMKFIPVFVTVALADVVGDVLYYALGRWGFDRVVSGFFGRFLPDVKKIQEMKDSVKAHSGKILFLGKLSHAIGAPVLIAAGLAGVPLNEFVLYNFLATIPKSFILLLVGYNFGSALGSVTRYLKITVLGLVLVTAVLILLYVWLVRVSRKAMNKIEKDK